MQTTPQKLVKSSFGMCGRGASPESKIEVHCSWFVRESLGMRLVIVYCAVLTLLRLMTRLEEIMLRIKKE